MSETQKGKFLQEEALGVVEKGDTSVQEVLRVMKGGDAAPQPQEPVTVRLEAPQAKPLEIIQTVVGPLLAPLATAGLVVIFVIFVLLEREDLRDRFIKLAVRA